MTTPEKIKTILKDQLAGYRALRDLLQKERERLVHLNAEGVESLSKEKDTVVLTLRLLEEERVRLVTAYAADAGAPQETSLQSLAERTGDDEFRSLRLQMVSLLQGISELNEFNRILIDRSASVVKNALTYLGAFGLAGLPPRASGSVLSREA